MDFSHLILPEVQQLLAAGDSKALEEVLSDLHAADVAGLLHHLDDAGLASAFAALRGDHRVHSFEQMHEDDQVRLLDLVGVRAAAPLVEEMASDDRVDLVQRLPPKTAEALLPLLAQADRDDIKRLLSYPEGSAGSMMSTEYATLLPDIPVSQGIEELRRAAPHKESIYTVFVVDRGRHILGVVSLHELIVARSTARVDSIMTEDVITAPVTASREDVARLIQKYDFLLLPIVDDQGAMVGIVTHDDVIDVIQEEATEDAQRMGAVVPIEEPYFRAGLWRMALSRGTWLTVLFLGETFTANALKSYEHELARNLTLAIFIPLIISSGGNSGSQSASLLTRSIALGEVSLRDWWRVAAREISMGLMLGLFLGVVGFGRAMLVGSTALSAVVALALVGVVTVGAVVGALLPLLLKRCGLDPAISSTPFVASIVDVLGLTLYLSIARVLLP